MLARLLYSEQCWPGESSLFLRRADKKYARLLHIFQCDNFCSFVNELSEGKRYDRLK
ncbi:putrescine/spermidine ABC transporter substrate-binding protein [Escherichia sp. E4208]|nr:putrescine/spermidine ABC transporter substrate-binding protein [Escherichia sp. E4742]TGB58243.1 putrescine/spermidine ABC transporter substrate-binding protein [Escherichia sp. E5028]TGB64522.1 putrescine/spermidine ABC transporter substrate-binding protein [Escherichia sp. E4930]TGB64805.1 putrescine/spermidine ABC transporter substrate-binding protein [Escherichia coli]TGB72814.1 putrescine/spermidine ABC transporter substrate-binding protein [Escherichia sp. E4702]TGB87717.1 putrescine